jgi:beta-lactamase regulating signal transducer with metallopeptidase domain
MVVTGRLNREVAADADSVREEARRLRRNYGETLTNAEVHAEMGNQNE